MAAILLINPNTSPRTTEMMLAVARTVLPAGSTIRGVTAARGPEMILDEDGLATAADEVVRIGREQAEDGGAVIVSAFGDPGALRLRAVLSVPVIGLGEAALREAAAGSRPFGIATTTPDLVRMMEAAVEALGLGAAFTGVRVSSGDPLAHAADEAGQDDAVGRAVDACLARDGAERVIIGGGPLSASAARLRRRFGASIVEPLPAAVRAMVRAVEPQR